MTTGAPQHTSYNTGLLSTHPAYAVSATCKLAIFLVFTMRLLILVVFTSLMCLRFPATSSSVTAPTDSILAGQALAVNDKLISKNGRYAFGFFETGSKSSQNTTNWYLGIWFHVVPKFTSVWVANRDEPIKNTTSLELVISDDGNLVILNRSTKSIIWSTRANTTGNSTTAMLLSNGNLILASSLSSSDVLWQSFDHPTNTQLPGQKFGWDKITGLNRRLFSFKNSISPATGAYCNEFDPSGVNRYLLRPVNSNIPYWTSGIWNGQTFPSVSQSNTQTTSSNSTFVDNGQQKYFVYYIDESVIFRHVLEVSGQTKGFIWSQGNWVLYYSQPKAQCDVNSVCGPFTICNDDAAQNCACMEGFTVTSPDDWELDDRTGGCSRNTPLNCMSNKSTTLARDKFSSVACVSLPQNGQKEVAARSNSECAQVCLSNCSCNAYSFGDSGCSVWHNELLNVRQLQCSGTSTSSNGETLYLRLSGEDTESSKDNRRKIIIGVATGTCFVALGLFALILMIWRNKRRSSGRILNGAQGCNGITVFRYSDLQHTTKNFTDKLGAGSFGSVFKGFISDSVAIAVKRLDGAYQGEKQFRAEVSSIGAIHHINLVKLVGFCCEGSKRLLVYEHMPNRSLDVHLFRSNSMILNWNVRYQISLGVARGLAYLHESCRERIIHCDIKPENILLDASFLPKIADFGMAKLLGRDFSRVLTTMRGTAGYLAPEWIAGVPITPKVDVYSYGMVLLEILSGRRNSSTQFSSGDSLDVFFPVHAANKLIEGDIKSLVDPRLCDDVNLDQADLICKVACWCIQDDESDRPTMGEVVQILEGHAEITLPPVPRLLQAMAGNSN